MNYVVTLAVTCAQNSQSAVTLTTLSLQASLVHRPMPHSDRRFLSD